MSSNEQTIAELRAALQELQEEFQRIAEAPHSYATVIATDGDRLVLSSGGNLQNVKAPAKIKLASGDTVLLDMQSGQIISTDVLPHTGDITRIQLMRTDGLCDVGINGTTRTVLTGKIKDLKEDDEVILDPSKMVIVAKLASPKKERFAVVKGTGVCWNDIGGQETAKQAMREAIELPLLNSKIYQAYGRRDTKGILLSGAPGCGKTMLGKAAATAISELTGASSAFMYIKGPEVLDPYVGVAEQTIRTIFQKAREHKEIHGAPAVIFIDEADAILGKRGSFYAHMEKTIVPMFLTEMDGLESSGALVILATNRPDTLDPAIVRDGRMDRKVRVERPTERDSKAIFKLYLSKVPVSDDVESLSRLGAEGVFDIKRTIRTTFKGESVNLPLQALASGSLIAGVVDKAVSHALRRDLDSKRKSPSGVSEDDLVSALDQAAYESRDVDHTDAIAELAERVRGYEHAEAAE